MTIDKSSAHDNSVVRSGFWHAVEAHVVFLETVASQSTGGDHSLPAATTEKAQQTPSLETESFLCDDKDHGHDDHGGRTPLSTDSRDSPTSETPRHSGHYAGLNSWGPSATTPTSDRHSDGGGFPAGASQIVVYEESEHSATDNPHDPPDLFPDLPDPKKRKFILVEDIARRSRLRVRASLDTVDTREIPDSFRKGFSVYPRSYFPREMQEPPPSATGAAFFPDDVSDDEDIDFTSADMPKLMSYNFPTAKVTVRVPVTGNDEASDGVIEVRIGRITNTRRSREVRLNDLGHRMAWLQSRVFAGRPVFLQRALDCYRAKTLHAMEIPIGEDGGVVGQLYTSRLGKKMWDEHAARLADPAMD